MKHLASWNEKLALAGCALKGSIFPAEVGIFVEENDKREYKLEALPEKRENGMPNPLWDGGGQT